MSPIGRSFYLSDGDVKVGKIAEEHRLCYDKNKYF